MKDLGRWCGCGTTELFRKATTKIQTAKWPTSSKEIVLKIRMMRGPQSACPGAIQHSLHFRLDSNASNFPNFQQNFPNFQKNFPNFQNNFPYFSFEQNY